MDKVQRIGVSGFLLEDEKVLIVKRADSESFLPGVYELPGGKIDFGETIESAIEREFKEETGLNVKAIKPIYIFSYLSDEGNRQTFDVTYLLRLKDGNGKVVLSDDHNDFKWISEEEIDDYNITKDMEEAIQKGFDPLRKHAKSSSNL